MTGVDARFTGNIPQHYDQGLGPVIFVDYALEMARRAAALKPKRILEIAAGTGIVTRRLRDALPAEASLTATDLNAPMLEIARAKFRADEKVAFQPADALALPFPDASFDTVVCQFGIMFYPDRPKSYREAYRVLEPGGRYLFSTWDSHRYNAFGRVAHEVVTRLFPVDPPLFYKAPYSCAEIDPIKQAALEAGFTDFTASVITVQKQIPDLAAFARGMVFGNPLVEQIQTRGGDPVHVEAEILNAFRREFGAEPLPLQAIMFSATRP
jgi:SAM-dependent methyltransferase